MDFQKDYYSILEINLDASPRDIKRSYRRLAKRYHPDLNPENQEYEEISKLLNEAYSVLGNQHNKFIYDNYRNSRSQNPNLRTPTAPTDIRKTNKRTFVKKSTLIKRKYIFIIGRIHIKYYAPEDYHLTENINDIYYKIHPTAVTARVNRDNIYRYNEPPIEVIDQFNTLKPSPFILQKTIIEIIEDTSSTFYELEIHNPKIANPQICNVTKHEGVSYGELAGDFYARFEFTEEYEEDTIVEECFGETGRKEHLTKGDTIYTRFEVFNSDCSTYWGPWKAENGKPGSAGQDFTGPMAHPFGRHKGQYGQKWYRQGWYRRRWRWIVGGHYGCGPTFPALLLLGYFCFVLFSVLPLLSSILLIIGGLILAERSVGIVRILLRWAVLLLPLVIVIILLNRIPNKITSPETQNQTNNQEYTTVKPIRENRQVSRNSTKDQVISHRRVWNDYAENRYEGDLKIMASDYRSAIIDHKALNINLKSELDWPVIYHTMWLNDQVRIEMLYSTFDSIKRIKNLDRIRFAEMIVSCIQDIPYHIVVPDECEIERQSDPTIRNFIEQNPLLCLGNIRFGVQSPAEFLGNLKGDCDTRVMLLFTILDHYGYEVAIMGSTHFRHSVLGIDLPVHGLRKFKNGVGYILWETTSKGFKPGILAPEVSNLQYWNVYLTNNYYGKPISVQ